MLIVQNTVSRLVTEAGGGAERSIARPSPASPRRAGDYVVGHLLERRDVVRSGRG